MDEVATETRFVGMPLAATLTFADWEGALHYVLLIARSHEWWVGDVLNHEMADTPEGIQAISDVLEDRRFRYLAAHTIENIRSVGRRFPLERRRPDLPWSYHAEVAYLPPAGADALLAQAAAEGWTRADLRSAKTSLNGKGGDADAKGFQSEYPSLDNAGAASVPVDGGGSPNGTGAAASLENAPQGVETALLSDPESCEQRGYHICRGCGERWTTS